MISKLLVDEHNYFRASNPSSNRVSGKIAHGEFEFSAGDRSPETIGLRTSSSVANTYPPQAKPSLPDPCLSRERFNAALAAGLMDPSRIELADPSRSPTESDERARTVSDLDAGNDSHDRADNGTSGSVREIRHCGANAVCLSDTTKTIEAIQQLGTPTQDRLPLSKPSFQGRASDSSPSGSFAPDK